MPTTFRVTVRRMLELDMDKAAQVHAAAFPRQTFSKDWLQCVFRAFPKSQLFSGMFPVDEVYMIAKDVDVDPLAESFVL